MRFFVVDAFTDRAFAGNSAGVVLLDEPADPTWMQAVATEMKHAETAFVVTTTTGPKSLRWFTPAVEVALCGHATVAVTHVLGGEQTYTTKSGELRAKAEDGWVELDFPSDPPTPTDDDLSEILPGVEIEYVGRGVENLFAVLTRRRDGQEPRTRPREAQAHLDRPPAGHRRKDERLRQPLLRAGRRHRRRPGHRLGALHPVALLVRTAPARANSPATRFPNAAGSSGPARTATASTSPARPSPS